jgi:hypothetical protein
MFRDRRRGSAEGRNEHGLGGQGAARQGHLGIRTHVRAVLRGSIVGRISAAGFDAAHDCRGVALSRPLPLGGFLFVAMGLS